MLSTAHAFPILFVNSLWTLDPVMSISLNSTDIINNAMNRPVATMTYALIQSGDPGDPQPPQEIPPGQPDELPPMDPEPPMEVPPPDQPYEVPPSQPSDIPPMGEVEPLFRQSH